MDAHEKTAYETQSKELRTQLKTWENEWAKAHGGQKPAHSDIKEHQDIAQKYKQYNKLRDMLAGKITAPVASRKRRFDVQADPHLCKSPAKRFRTATAVAALTPSNTSFHEQYLPSHDQADNEITTPSLNRKLFSPQVPTSIGPTPQRDGRVLGLFDLLSDTPSKASDSDVATMLQTTPSGQPRTSSSTVEGDSTLMPPLGRTPRKRTAAITPLQNRDGNIRTSSSWGMSSVSRLTFETPAFLRRGPRPAPQLARATTLPSLGSNGLAGEQENNFSFEDESWKLEPLQLCLPRKPFGRSLSEMVASLRKMEEDKANEELEALRELEADQKVMAMGGAGGTASNKPKGVTSGKDGFVAAMEVDVGGSPPQQPKEKSQRPNLLCGFDAESLYDRNFEETFGRGEQPLRVYKKKGQKRTTRLVKMRPTRTKRPAAEAETTKDDQAQLLNDACGPDDEAGDHLMGLGSEPGGDSADKDPDYDYGSQDKKKPEMKKRGRPCKKQENYGQQKEEGVVKKAVRKIKATAHQNFKRLKLKNKGPNGGTGYNSRFRRRR